MTRRYIKTRDTRESLYIVDIQPVRGRKKIGRGILSETIRFPRYEEVIEYFLHNAGKPWFAVYNGG